MFHYIVQDNDVTISHAKLTDAICFGEIDWILMN